MNSRTTNKRIPTQPNELIDRYQTVTFTFEGREYSAHPGDTIASALAANGLQVISRSFKYHRPRGLLCCAGHCPNCLVQIGDEPNVRACMRPVEEGMVVEAQNVRPSLERDVMSLTKLGDRFLPVGFYYKTFIHPQRMWPVYEKLLRGAAGLGKVNPESTNPDSYDKQYLHTDVAVIGGGPTGMSAAVAAAESGAHVILFDENLHLGGHTRYSDRTQYPNIPISQYPNLKVYLNTTVLGRWEENWLTAVSQQRLYKIRAKAVIFATGAIEQPFIFANNDLPGVMLGSGVQRLLNLYGVKVGETAVIITANDEGWQVAADLQAAGVTVTAVVDERMADETRGNLGELGGTQVHWGYTILAAEGSGKVQQAIIAPVDEHGQVSTGAKKTIDCDLIAVSMGWMPANGLLYQAGAKIEFDHGRALFLPASLPKNVFAVGRIMGTFDVKNSIQEGQFVGKQAAAFAGFGPMPETEKREQESIRHTSTLVKVPGKGKKFVCFCEDVTDEDLDTAIAEGYDSIELLKRYSTISMGPCQGKMCSLNTIHLCARANGWTIAETGTTTSRPPITPVALGALAGQMMEPVKYTPIHDWHIEQGAKMMVAGLWLRPEYYGDVRAEVTAVRQRVGLIDISTLGKLKLTGPGVPNLLDRIYINKWQKLAVGRVGYGLMCNDEGIIMDDGVTAHVDELEWYMTTTSSGATAVYEWIQWWVQSGWGNGVHITNVSEGYAAFNLAGPQSRTLLEKLTEADISNETFPYMHVRELELAGVPCWVMRIGFTGELSYEIHCGAGYGRALWKTIMQAGEAFDISPFGVEAQRILRLEKAHIIVGQDTDALSDPLGANMAWAVKLDKGDFLGIRALTRIADEGLKQKLVGFKMVDKTIVPEEGLQIVRPNTHAPIGLEIIGWVTSSRYSPTLDEVIGLCWLPLEMAGQGGAMFTIRREGQLVEARVHHGAFYDPDGLRLRG
ncbi:MAG: FAD-dependent oxidoreductase [Chloroflexi bacterium]|nr:FAD-dependent oxidoreductase [Chloroflexota bacterium]